MPCVFKKDPNAELNYTVDWATWLGADTIATSTWTVPTAPGELTNLGDSNTTTTATIKLGGGTVGQEYEAVNRILTAAGETEDRTLTFIVEEK